MCSAYAWLNSCVERIYFHIWFPCRAKTGVKRMVIMRITYVNKNMYKTYGTNVFYQLNSPFSGTKGVKRGHKARSKTLKTSVKKINSIQMDEKLKGAKKLYPAE